ncbi:MAG: nitrilase-related carbon-nitrogen hydrolase [Thermovirgaceae bacterium]
MDGLRVGLLQLDVYHGNPGKNLGRAYDRIEKAARDRCRILVLPELWNATCPVTNPKSILDVKDAFFDMLRSVAVRYETWIITGSLAVSTPDGKRNRCYIFPPDGGRDMIYDKVHLYPGFREPNLLEAGSSLGLFSIDGTDCGVMICFDMEFPEVARALTERGAKIIFVPGAWNSRYIRLWRTLLVARAIENQSFVVGVNRCDRSKRIAFGGQSMVIDPYGDVVLHMDDRAGFESVFLELDLVNRARKEHSVFSSRRPEIYRKWF